MQNNKEFTNQFARQDCWNQIGVRSESEERCPELARFVHCRNCPVYTTFGRQQLDQEPSEEYIQEWTAFVSSETSSLEGKKQSAFIFRAGGEWLALPAGLVVEVVDMGIIHSIPHRSSKILRGVVSIRGRLELCFSIGAVLGIGREETPNNRNKYLSPERLIVAQSHGRRIVFPVSQVFGIIRFSKNMLQQLPVTVSGSKAALTRGILCIDNEFDVGLLEPEMLFDALTRSL